MGVENPDIQAFLALLLENGREGQAKDFSALLKSLADMDRQFAAVQRELAEVKQQLAEAAQKKSPVRNALIRMVEGLEAKVVQMQDRLSSLWDKITDFARNAVAQFRDSGIAALDKALTALDVKQDLWQLQESLRETSRDAKAAVERGEKMGQELRSAGGHVKNAALAAVGKEAGDVESDREGRFQKAVLAPVRGVEKLLTKAADRAIDGIDAADRLSLAAAAARERTAERKAQRKPSVLERLKEKKAEIAAKPAPAKVKQPNRAEI